MQKIYLETPDNFSEIEDYVIVDSAQIVDMIIHAEKCYFYDTCSFRKHMMLPCVEGLFSYIKATKGIIVVTRCILMELCSSDGSLWEQHISYFRKLYEAEIRVIVLYEEYVYDILAACYADIEKINRCLTLAVHTMKSKTGTIERTLKQHPDLEKHVLSDRLCKERALLKQFFQMVRQNKTTGDNLGEELNAICIHMLTNIPDIAENKYIFWTEDKGAVSLFGKAISNVNRHTGRKHIAVMTTTKLVQILLQSKMITTKEQVLDILRAGNTGDAVKVVCLEQYDIMEDTKTMTCEKLAEQLTNGSGIYVLL